MRTFGTTPVKGWTPDRTNPADPEYSPEKCVWAPKRVQTRNRRNTVLIVNAKGVARTPEEWVKHSKGKLNADTLRKRKRRGWTDLENLGGRRDRASVVTPAVVFPTKRSSEVNKGEFEMTWMVNMNELYPDDSHLLTARERGMLESARKFFEENGFGYEHYPEDVLKHAIRNWPSLMQRAKREGLRKSEFPTVAILAGSPRLAVSAYLQANDLVHENRTWKPRPVQHDAHVLAWQPRQYKLAGERRERQHELERAMQTEKVETEERDFEAFKAEVMASFASSPETINQHDLAIQPDYEYPGDAKYACMVLRNQIKLARSGSNRHRLFVFERQLDYWQSRLPAEVLAEPTPDPTPHPVYVSPMTVFKAKAKPAHIAFAKEQPSSESPLAFKNTANFESMPELGSDEFFAMVAAIKVTGEV